MIEKYQLFIMIKSIGYDLVDKSVIKYIIKTKTETDIQIDRHRQIDVSDR